MFAEYLVTGGAGALGKLIISMLLEQGVKVRILMSERADVSDYKDANLTICYGISTDKDSMNDFFAVEDPRHSVLIHADEYISMSPESNLIMRRVNVTGAQNVMDMCMKRKIGRFVYLSSAYALDSSVKGENVSIHFDRTKASGDYAKTKAEASAYLMEKVALNRFNAVMVLPTFIIGPGYSEDYEINKILKSYLKNGVHPVKGGGHAFVDVRDVANAMVALTEEGEPGSGYIISGEYKTSQEFFEGVNETQGIDAPVKTASRILMSKPLAKFVDAYYKRTHKDNPKQVYALFQDNPEAKYEGTGANIIKTGSVDFKESITDSIEYLATGAAAGTSMKDLAEETASGNAAGMKGSSTAAVIASRKERPATGSREAYTSSSSKPENSTPVAARPAVAASRPAARPAATPVAPKASEIVPEEPVDTTPVVPEAPATPAVEPEQPANPYRRQILTSATPTFFTSGASATVSQRATATPAAPAAPVVDEPIIDEPVIAEPVIDEPIIEESAPAQPVFSQSAFAQPAVDEPIVAESAAVEPEAPVVPDNPVITEPSIDEFIPGMTNEDIMPAVEEPAPVAEEPAAVEAPAAEEPAAAPEAAPAMRPIWETMAPLDNPDDLLLEDEDWGDN